MNEEENIPGENSNKEGIDSKVETTNENIVQEQTEDIRPHTSDTGNQASAITPSDIKNMEVHHHPSVEKKNFKEYFLEFIMIFLAVAMGFFAENIREYISDTEKEKEFMKSLVQDIKDDTSIIRYQNKTFEKRVVLLDSLVDILNEEKIISNTSNLYYYGRLVTKSYAFRDNTKTIDEIKNTGGFRLIRNKQVITDILAYYAVMRQIKELEVSQDEESNEYRKIAVRIFNAAVFNQMNSTSLNSVTRPAANPALRTDDKKLLGDLAGWVHYIKNTEIGINQYENALLAAGRMLIQQIEKEYQW